MHIVRGFAFRQRLYCSAMKVRCASRGHEVACVAVRSLFYFPLAAIDNNGLCSPRLQYSTSSSCFNDRLSWLIVKQKKASNGLLLDERTGVDSSIGARCGAVDGGVLLLKLVSVVVLS